MNSGKWRPIDTLVTKIVTDFVDPIEPTHDTSLQIQLIGDSEVQTGTKGLVVRHKGRCGCTPVHGLQHGCLDLNVGALVKEFSNQTNDMRPHDEHVPNLRVHRQIHIPLAIKRFGIGHLTVLLPLRILLPQRQRSQGFREKLAFLHLDRDFFGARFEQRTLHTDEITQVQKFDQFVRVFANIVPPKIKLYLARTVAEMEERRLAVLPHRDNAPGCSHRHFLLVAAIGIENLLSRVRSFEPVGERRDAACDQRLEFLAACSLDVTSALR